MYENTVIRLHLTGEAEPVTPCERSVRPHPFRLDFARSCLFVLKKGSQIYQLTFIIPQHNDPSIPAHQIVKDCCVTGSWYISRPTSAFPGRKRCWDFRDKTFSRKCKMVAPAVPEYVQLFLNLSQRCRLLGSYWLCGQAYGRSPTRIHWCANGGLSGATRIRTARSGTIDQTSPKKSREAGMSPSGIYGWLGTYSLKLWQVGVYHHVTGVDASSSASLAAYINTLTYKETNQSTTKIVEGIYW